MESDATKLVNRKKLFDGDVMYTMCCNGTHPLYELAQKYLQEFPGKDVHPENKNFDKSLDLKEKLRARIITCAKSLGPKLVARFLPTPVIRKLTGDTVEICMGDRTGSHYDAIKNQIEAKGTDDFYHEIGHFYWNKAIIPSNESEQREAVKKSLSADRARRISLEDRLLPSTHKRYAKLVGAHSGQFLFPNGTFNIRLNDLDEHFARNFDYLVRGQPLEVLDRSKTAVKDMLDFYQDVGMIDAEFRKFYEASMQYEHGPQGLKKIGPPYKMEDGNPLQLSDIADLIVFKKRVKDYLAYAASKMPQLPLIIELGLRLDITPGFASYCLTHSKEIVLEAMQYTGTGNEKIVEKVKKS